MTPDGAGAASVWAGAALAAELFGVTPDGLGGVLLRAGPGPARDRFCGWLQALLPAGAPLLRLPLHVTEDRLLGGLALAATLRAGRVVAEMGLLAQANGGVVVAAMAERLEPSVTAHLCAALDRGALSLERDGLTATAQTRLGVVALDEGIDEERAPAPLRDRLGLHLDLGALGSRDSVGDEPDPARVKRARALFDRVQVPDAIVQALCEAAISLGIDSLRAALLAVCAARAHAALEGRLEAEEDDAVAAARLVLGPRATRMPAPEKDEDDQDDEDAAEEPPPDEPPDEPPPEQPQQIDADRPLEEVVLEAARSGIPAGLLDALLLGRDLRSSQKGSGKAGALKRSTDGGRPAGVRPGLPQAGQRLNLVETLRAAAPWQPLRRRERAERGEPASRRIEVRKEDLRITRFQQNAETSVIFAVDASGSAALQRLAEAKGAVEQVLGDCYVRRDQVALIAFRGTAATLVLSPTRSLVRVRRSLARLAGGGTTPLAAGIDAGCALALDARKRGHTPVLVVMTDGRANIARDGRGDRPAATADAHTAARAVRAACVKTLFLDTAPRPSPAARLLALEMGARYLPLPYLDPVGISLQVQALAEADA